jgi:hypothetical protein
MVKMITDKYNYRPKIKTDLTEPLLKLSNRLNLSAQSIVNVCVKIGIEAIEKSSEIIITDIESKIKELQPSESKQSKSIKAKNKTNK